jgi:hypothetical protein
VAAALSWSLSDRTRLVACDVFYGLERPHEVSAAPTVVSYIGIFCCDWRDPLIALVVVSFHMKNSKRPQNDAVLARSIFSLSSTGRAQQCTYRNT